MKKFILKHLSTIVFSLILLISVFILIISGEISDRIIFAKWDRNSVYIRRGCTGSKKFVIEPPNDVSVRHVVFSKTKTGILDSNILQEEQKGIEGFEDFKIEIFGRKNVLKTLSFKEMVCDDGKKIRISQQEIVDISRIIFPDLYSCIYYLRFSNEDVEPGKEYNLKKLIFTFENREYEYPLDLIIIGTTPEEERLLVFRSEGESNGVLFKKSNKELPFYKERIENVTQADVEVLKIEIVGNVKKYVTSVDVSQRLPCTIKPGESLEYAFYGFCNDFNVNWIYYAPRVTYKIRGDSKSRYYYPGTGSSKIKLEVYDSGEVFPELFFQEIKVRERSN
ncbi:hypothetical protein Ferpe_0585 [Fervidobacterium pennivorans DSM 9078]|uniref:Uncharacterized protein n=1 Tax=Fervidobacterium pennivorans (strain DSM 9078 / Ven5) TaxID=771875 RepID=H9UB23_FERPD|nr:hypothetical protein [Fervidobacterium pennivorans]AFG34716.1 hypothetical protein Ferpe_0585 [Fervidobacterium pennivorans DSM 9078]